MATNRYQVTGHMMVMQPYDIGTHCLSHSVGSAGSEKPMHGMQAVATLAKISVSTHGREYLRQGAT